jgi:hypothetical protein
MPKQLTKAFVTQSIAKVTGFRASMTSVEGMPGDGDEMEVNAFVRAMPDDQEIDMLCAFEPPQSLLEWQGATNVSGHLSNSLFLTTKSRGDRLQQVDRAYKAWIEHPAGITHAANAENLFNALEKYRGVLYKLAEWAEQGSFKKKFQGNYREERDRDGVMTKVHALVYFITALSSAPMKVNKSRNRRIRKQVLTLFANIDVEWDFKADLLGGLGLLPVTNELLAFNDAHQKIVYQVAGGVAAGIGGIYVISSVASAADKTQFLSGLLPAVKAVGQAFWDFLCSLFEKFKTWAAAKIKALMGGDMQEILGLVSMVLKIIFKFCLDSAKDLLGPATDIAKGVVGLCQDAWLRSTISAQKAILVTTDGAFALVRNGIEYGIKCRQAVAGWSLTKGVVSGAVSLTTGAGKIADLVLGSLELAFKLIYAALENRRIHSVLAEAKALFQRMSPSVDAAVEAAPADAETGAPSWTGMPDFKSASYTPAQFIDNWKGAYLNFLHSAVNASPVMATIIMNSGVIADVRDILHPATPRSTDDEVVALEHLKTLKAEAVALYTKSSFKVLPAKVGDLGAASERQFQRLLNNAKLAPSIPVVSA